MELVQCNVAGLPKLRAGCTDVLQFSNFQPHFCCRNMESSRPQFVRNFLKKILTIAEHNDKMLWLFANHSIRILLLSIGDKIPNCTKARVH